MRSQPAVRRRPGGAGQCARADVRDDDFAHVVESFEPPGPDKAPLLYEGYIL